MIAYLINMTLCALLLYVIYALLLENENRHRFKRFYLLVSVVFSMLVPFIVIEIDVAQMPVNLDQYNNKQLVETIMNRANQHDLAETESLRGPVISAPLVQYSRALFVIYLIITSFFLFRLVRNSRQMLLQAHNNKLDYRGAKIVLVNKQITPYSFGQYIFINREDYCSGLVPDEIIVHEWAHVRQRHTYDILFIELLIAFGWFNPVFYLYRNKIRLNHEFLADEAVVGKNRAIVPDYLSILINHIPQNRKISFNSNFNYLFTKKRLVMITKITSKKRVWCSSIALIPAFIAAVFIFSTKTIAQHDMNVLPEPPNGSIEIPNQDNNRTVTSAVPQDSKLANLLKDNVFAARYNDYNQIIADHTTEKDGRKYIQMNSFSKEDLERMKDLFQSMSPEQQSVIIFVPQRIRWFDEKIPTKEIYESWKTPTEYGIWLDGKRIENSELDRYQPSDFSFYFVSRLARNAKNYGKHVYQLDLYSTAYYQKIKAEWDADEKLYLMPNIPSRTQ